MEPKKKLELIALEEGDIHKWAQLCSHYGEIMPTDEKQLEHTFHLARLRCKEIGVPLRKESRDLLVKNAVIKHEPVSILEKLHSNKMYKHKTSSVKTILNLKEGFKEIVLVFSADFLRSRVFKDVTNELAGKLDLVRSNVRRWEIYTLEGVHIKFLLEDEEYELPMDTDKVAYRFISNVF